MIGSTSLPKVSRRLREQRLAVADVLVDPVDDDHAWQAALRRHVQDAPRRRLNALVGGDDDRHRLGRRQDRERLAEEVGEAGRVDQVDEQAVVPKRRDRRIEAVAMGLLLGLEVADGVAVLDAPGLRDHAGVRKQTLGERRLARAAVADEGDVAGGPGVPIAGVAVVVHRGAFLSREEGRKRKLRGPRTAVAIGRHPCPRHQRPEFDPAKRV